MWRDFFMNKFKSWLLDRDTNLLETMSREKMMEDDLDALNYAKKQKRQEKELDEKIRIIKYLAKIKKKIEQFVDAHDKGAQALKLIAASLLTHEKGREGIKTHVRHVYSKDLKSLKDLQKIFTHENLIKLFHDVDALHSLSMILDSDFESHVGNLEKDSQHGHIDHSHGELGKKFASFVVSHIKHAADDVLASFLQDHNKDEGQDDDVPQDQESGDEAAPDMSADEMNPDMEVGGSAQDAGQMGQDAGQMGQDAGQMGQDAGQMGQDAGQMGQDAGQMGQDAGQMGQDAGQMDQDAGQMDQDGSSEDNALMPPVGMAAPQRPAGTEGAEGAEEDETQTAAAPSV